MKGTLCCIFNYAPLYRQAVYRAMDDAFDVQFCFADEPIYGQGTQGIAQMDTSTLRRPVRKIRNRMLFGRHPWRAGFRFLPLKRQYSTFLVTGDFNWAYLPFLVLSRVLGKRVYAWGHGLKTATQFKGVKRLFYNLLTGYFFYSEGGARLMQEAGYPKEKCHVIYNSLTDKLLPKQNESLKSDIYEERFGNNDPVLLFSGRLQPAKKVALLMDAVSRLNADGLNCNLIIIGDGPEREKLEALAGNLPVWFYGECYDEKRLAELFYNADLCVSPGNVGLVAIHSMQYGLPVVSHSNFETQMPEYEVIVEGKTGTLFKDGDPDDLCRVIRVWLDTHKDRDEIRNACYKVISEH
ncbi:MAG: glycosyltransferase, partial [Bacteroidales bacterium]|nr:glycosyltransferase [Bacteroidales bacterium]